MNIFKSFLLFDWATMGLGAREWNLVVSLWLLILLFKTHKNGIEMSGLEFILPIVAALIIKFIIYKIKSNKIKSNKITNEQ